MKKIFIISIVLLSSVIFAQNIYDVSPGSKNNQINFKFKNLSETIPANAVKINLLTQSHYIDFGNDAGTIELVEPNNEKEINFTFDVKRNASVNTKDTLNFMIAEENGTMMLKSVILNFTPPKEFKLEQNFPNPFNPATTIQYQLPQDTKVTLKVYDILGGEVTTLINEEQDAGYKEVKFNGIGYASGVYIYRLHAGDFISIKKMIMVK